MGVVTLKTLPALALDVSIPLDQIKPSEPSLETRAIFREALDKGKAKDREAFTKWQFGGGPRPNSVILLPGLAEQIYLCRNEEIANREEVSIKYAQAKANFLVYGIVFVGVAVFVHFLAVSVFNPRAQYIPATIIFTSLAFLLGVNFIRLLNFKNEVSTEKIHYEELKRTIELYKKYFDRDKVEMLRGYIESKITELKDDPEKQQNYKTALEQLNTAYELCQMDEATKSSTM